MPHLIYVSFIYSSSSFNFCWPSAQGVSSQIYIDICLILNASGNDSFVPDKVRRRVTCILLYNNAAPCTQLVGMNGIVRVCSDIAIVYIIT